MSHAAVPVTRRVFLGTAAAVAASFRPALARQAPSDQVVVGLIGVGGMGTNRLREFVRQPDVRIAAIADVDKRHVDRAIALVEKERGHRPVGYGDFRRLLTTREIDAVTVVTPDHWHAIAAVRAFEAGKDVFVEKPLSYTVAEGRAMADASLQHKRVTQMGNHIHAGSNYRRVVELVQSGKLGRIRRVETWVVFNPTAITNGEPATVPPELDYDFWLGPAPKRPYEPLRSHFTFRHFWDYSGGTFIDFWCHIVDVAIWALDLPAPKSVAAVGGRLQLTDNRTETPDTVDALLEYPNLMFSYRLRPSPPPGFEHMGNIGCILEGRRHARHQLQRQRSVGEGKEGRGLSPAAPVDSRVARARPRVPGRREAADARDDMQCALWPSGDQARPARQHRLSHGPPHSMGRSERAHCGGRPGQPAPEPAVSEAVHALDPRSRSMGVEIVRYRIMSPVWTRRGSRKSHPPKPGGTP